MMTPETKQEILRLYRSGRTGDAIAEHLQIGRDAVYGWLHKNNATRPLSLAMQRHSIDSAFFDQPNEANAYWLGFLTADGNVSGNTLQVDLAYQDVKHLEMLKADLKSSHPIVERHTPYHQCRFAVSNEQLVRSLADLGMLPRKSLTSTPWMGPTELMRHYWRGVIDGDGTLYEAGNKLHIGLTGTMAMCEGFRLFVGRLVPTRAKVSKGHGNCYDFRVAGVEFVQRIVHELYRDTTRALERKRQLAVAFQQRTPKVRGRNQCNLPVGDVQ